MTVIPVVPPKKLPTANNKPVNEASNTAVFKVFICTPSISIENKKAKLSSRARLIIGARAVINNSNFKVGVLFFL